MCTLVMLPRPKFISQRTTSQCPALRCVSCSTTSGGAAPSLQVEQQAPDAPPKRVPRLHPRPPPPGSLTCVNLDGCELGGVCGGNVAAEEGEGSPDTEVPNISEGHKLQASHQRLLA
mmetsp:Transcript_33602/g.100400  ORF Transcript_33602/g.100400 Transcript_33602/m.100400 type:complete len:117 (-) Transcript_33602:431-781(-)